MDTDMVVKNGIADGQKLINLLAENHFDLTAACWVKTSEEGQWYFYIASKAVDEEGSARAYREVYTTLQSMQGPSMQDPWVSMSDIKLVGTANPIATDVLAIYRDSPGIIGTWLRKKALGNLRIEEAYIYSIPGAISLRKGFAKEDSKLKREIEKLPSLKDLLAPLSRDEGIELGRLMSAGMERERAEYWIRKKREELHHVPMIPAGTPVKTRIAAWWGNRPEDDPNPLLMVETRDGAQGLTPKDNTEPIETSNVH